MTTRIPARNTTVRPNPPPPPVTTHQPPVTSHQPPVTRTQAKLPVELRLVGQATNSQQKYNRGAQLRGRSATGRSCPPPQVAGKTCTTRRVRRRAEIRIVQFELPLRHVQVRRSRPA